jgi:EAL and modified HD-GYP domain-containing signal transduction protein
MTEIFLGRQAIFDRDQKVVGYELLFRHGEDTDSTDMPDGDVATSHVLESAFVDIGLDRLAGRYPVFINLTRNHLLKPPPIPPKQVVFEILEDIDFVKDTKRAIGALVNAGYKVAMDDYLYDPEHADLLDMVHIVKVDVLEMSPTEVSRQVNLLRKHRVKLLAEKIEDEETYTRCRDLGFHYFQGFYFSSPRIIRGRRLKTNQIAVMQLLREVHKPEADIKKLEKLISQDATLSYKLLQMINSSYYNFPQKVESVRRAMVYIGRDALSSWVSMLAMTSLDEKSESLMGISMTRAKMCELLTPEDMKKQKESFFTVGLFSVLDQFLQIPLEQILADLPMNDEVNAALLRKEGILGEALECAIGFEQIEAPAVHRFMDLDSDVIAAHYLEAVDWANTAIREMK